MGAKVSLDLVSLEQTKIYGTIRLLTLSTCSVFIIENIYRQYMIGDRRTGLNIG